MFSSIIRNSSKRISCINNSFVRYKSAYSGEGKTTVRVLNRETDLGLMIDAFANFGFKLNNGVTVLGPMAIFPRTVLSWQVQNSTDITPDSLRLFTLLEPKIDLVILGLDTRDRKEVGRVLSVAREAKVPVEILDTEHACTTFNFLNAEGRNIAAALIPPLVVDMTLDDELRAKVHYSELYENPALP